MRYSHIRDRLLLTLYVPPYVPAGGFTAARNTWRGVFTEFQKRERRATCLKVIEPGRMYKETH